MQRRPQSAYCRARRQNMMTLVTGGMMQAPQVLLLAKTAVTTSSRSAIKLQQEFRALHCGYLAKLAATKADGLRTFAGHSGSGQATECEEMLALLRNAQGYVSCTTPPDPEFQWYGALASPFLMMSSLVGSWMPRMMVVFRSAWIFPPTCGCSAYHLLY